MRPDFIVADIHTNPINEQVQHAGVGKVNVIYFIAETYNGPTIYVGPIFSYYQRIENGMKRLDDKEWADLVNRGSLTAPEWTKTLLSMLALPGAHKKRGQRQIRCPLKIIPVKGY